MQGFSTRPLLGKGSTGGRASEAGSAC